MTQELQAQEKREVQAEAEQTHTRPVFVPSVDIYESDQGLTLVADLPGVQKDGLSIDLKDNVLSLKGQVTVEEPGHMLYREYNVGDYARQFTLADTIDQDRIAATLKDGVLTLVLPKVEKAQPRRIEVLTA